MSTPITVGDAINIAVECFQAGEFETVRLVCEEILRAEPANVEALHLRALAHANLDDLEQGIVDLKHALLIRPNDFELLNNLGNFYKHTGEAMRARQCYEAALEQEPGCHPALFNLGNVLVELGELEAAKQRYFGVMELAADFAEVYYNLGLILLAEGSTEDALAQFKQCIARDTNHVSAQVQVGNCLSLLGRVDEAMNAYKVASVLDPSSAESFNGMVHLLQGDLEDAAESFSNVIADNPDNPVAYRNLGKTLMLAAAYDDAIMVYRNALRLQPNSIEVVMELAATYAKAGYAKQAVEYFEEAAQARPKSFIPVLGRGIALLPDHDALDAAVAALDASSDTLDALTLLQPDNLRRLPGTHRDLLEKFAVIASRIVCTRWGQWTQKLPMPARTAAGKIKVGVVSRKWHDRPNWRTVSSGITENLNLDKFQVFEYPTKGVSFEQLCTRIRKDDLHVLVYGDLDETAWQMAALRLAPVQCTTWARTDTTGLETIDYFLSGELVEPEDADAHYSEKLVRLPHSFMYYVPDLESKAVGEEGDVFRNPLDVCDLQGAMKALEMNIPIVTVRGATAKSRKVAAVLEQIGVSETIAAGKDEYDALVERLSTDKAYWHEISAKLADRKHFAYKDYETMAAFETWLNSRVP